MSPAPTGAGGLVVAPVRGRRDRKEFLHFPWKIYAGDPNWVPPLLHDVKTLLDRSKHPFHRHADVEYFLARRAGEVVGRIAAVVNHAHNEFHGDHLGFFGFFEAVDDVDVARALLDAAGAWLRERGMDAVRGPANFSSNEEMGLLVDGFDGPPVIMMTYNPPYYADLIEAAGYAKAKDLLAYRIDSIGPQPRLVAGVERLAARRGLTVRVADMKRFDEEVAVMEAIYNQAWERNWGFVPMTHEEFTFLAKQLKPVANPDFILIAEAEGEPIAFGIGLPDFNYALHRINGRLLPFGLPKLLWYSRKIDWVRVITLGIKPGYRRTGVDAMLYLEMFRNAPKHGIRGGECSWILEDNWEMRHALERMGAVVYRTYRMYDKGL